MDILAATDFDPVPITAWFALFLAIAATVSLITGVIIRVNRSFERRVSDLIKETTFPIQPEANGSLSMTDLHKKFDAMDEKVNRIETRYEQVIADEEQQRSAWHEHYLYDQQRIKREWTAVFIAIRKMIHLAPDEQAKAWDDITKSYIDGTIIDKFPDERTGS